MAAQPAAKEDWHSPVPSPLPAAKVQQDKSSRTLSDPLLGTPPKPRHYSMDASCTCERRFATAFILWLFFGLFGAHHFYLRGFRSLFTWLYCGTSVISFLAYILTGLVIFGGTRSALPEMQINQTAIVLACLPLTTLVIRWLRDLGRLPRLIDKANAPKTLPQPIITVSDAYALSFSGLCFGVHWLYLGRAFEIQERSRAQSRASSASDTEMVGAPAEWPRRFGNIKCSGFQLFLLNFVTLGGCGIWWLLQLVRMPYTVDRLLQRDAAKRPKIYKPTATVLLLFGFWCGGHNFYLYGVRSRYACIYAISSVLATIWWGVSSSMLLHLDPGAPRLVCFIVANAAAASLAVRLLVDLVRLQMFSLVETINESLKREEDREQGLSVLDQCINCYLLWLPAGWVGLHRVHLHGFNASTLIYLCSAGVLGLGFAYDLLDIPRLTRSHINRLRQQMLATQNASTANLSPTAYGAIDDCEEELPCAEDVRTLMVSDIAHQMAGGTPPSTATALPKVRVNRSTAINIRRGMAQQRAPQASFRKTGLGSKSLDQAFGSPQSLDDWQRRQLTALTKIVWIDFSNLKLGRKIDAGGSGQLYEAEYCGAPVAVKELFASLIDPSDQKEFMQETSTLASLRHPHVVTFHGVSYHSGHYYIVQELCYGSMHDCLLQRLSNGQRTTVRHILRWASGISKGLAFMHAKSCVHRDLKPKNILIDQRNSGRPKICDFGLSRMRNSRKRNMTQVAGTYAYMAPELAAVDHAEVMTAVDVYAFAVTLWWMLHFSDPYPELREPAILRAVEEGARPSISPSCPIALRNVIENCWAHDPARRPSMQQVSELIDEVRATSDQLDLLLPLQVRSSEAAAAAALSNV